MKPSKDFLLFGLQHFGINVIQDNGKYLDLVHNYQIEIENESLFRLSQNGSVIAPFDDVEELCNFIKMDMQQYEKN